MNTSTYHIGSEQISMNNVASPVMYEGEYARNDFQTQCDTKTVDPNFQLMLDPYSGEKERRRLSLVRAERLRNSKLAPDCTSPNALSPSAILVHNYMYQLDSEPVQSLFRVNGDQDLFFNAQVTQITMSSDKETLSKERVLLLLSDLNLYLITGDSKNFGIAETRGDGSNQGLKRKTTSYGSVSNSHIDMNIARFKSYESFPLTSIKTVAVSRFRDNFLVLHLTNDDETHQNSIVVHTDKKTEFIHALKQAPIIGSDIDTHALVQVIDCEFKWKDVDVSFGQMEYTEQMTSSRKCLEVGTDCLIDFSTLSKGSMQFILNKQIDQADSLITIESVFLNVKEVTVSEQEQSTLMQGSQLKRRHSSAHSDSPFSPSDAVIEQVHTERQVDITEQLEPTIMMPSKDASYSIVVKFFVGQPIYNCVLVERVETAFRTCVFTTQIGKLNTLSKQRAHTILIPPKNVKYSKVSLTRVELTLHGSTDPNSKSQDILMTKSFIYNVENATVARRHSVIGGLLNKLKRSSN